MLILLILVFSFFNGANWLLTSPVTETKGRMLNFSIVGTKNSHILNIKITMLISLKCSLLMSFLKGQLVFLVAFSVKLLCGV